MEDERQVWNIRTIYWNFPRCNSGVGFPEKLVMQVNVMNVRWTVNGSMQYTFTPFIPLIFDRKCLCNHYTWESHTNCIMGNSIIQLFCDNYSSSVCLSSRQWKSDDLSHHNNAIVCHQNSSSKETIIISVKSGKGKQLPHWLPPEKIAFC